MEQFKGAVILDVSRTQTYKANVDGTVRIDRPLRICLDQIDDVLKMANESNKNKHAYMKKKMRMEDGDISGP